MPKFKDPRSRAEFKRKMAERAERRLEEAAMEVAMSGPTEEDGPIPKTVIARHIEGKRKRRKAGLQPQFKRTYIVKNWPKFIPTCRMSIRWAARSYPSPR